MDQREFMFIPLAEQHLTCCSWCSLDSDISAFYHHWFVKRNRIQLQLMFLKNHQEFEFAWTKDLLKDRWDRLFSSFLLCLMCDVCAHVRARLSDRIWGHMPSPYPPDILKHYIPGTAKRGILWNKTGIHRALAVQHYAVTKDWRSKNHGLHRSTLGRQDCMSWFHMASMYLY